MKLGNRLFWVTSIIAALILLWIGSDFSMA